MVRRSRRQQRLDRASVHSGTKSRSHSKKARAAQNRPGRSSLDWIEQEEKRLRQKYVEQDRKYQVTCLLLALQPRCSYCGQPLGNHSDDHHLYARRNPDHPALYCVENITRVHPACHVPEPPLLGFQCALNQMRWGIATPAQIECWAREASGFFRNPIVLPPFYEEAKAAYEQEKSRLERQSGICPPVASCKLDSAGASVDA